MCVYVCMRTEAKRCVCLCVCVYALAPGAISHVFLGRFWHRGPFDSCFYGDFGPGDHFIYVFTSILAPGA